MTGSTAAETVNLQVTNLTELADALPEAGLATAIFDSLEMVDLEHMNSDFTNAWCPSVAQRVRMLVEITAPGQIMRWRTKGNRIECGPVDDFKAFADTIDYGAATASESTWTIEIEVKPEELSRARLIARAEQSGRRPRGLPQLLGKPADDFTQFSRFRKTAFELGDSVKVDLGGATLHGTVLETDAFKRVMVRIPDATPLLEIVQDRKLKKRIQQVDLLHLRFPGDMLEEFVKADRVQADTPPPVQPRTWSDSSGKFSVVATYAGMSGERVRLLKVGGKEILVPTRRLSEADQAYLRTRQSQEPIPAGTESVASWSVKRGVSKQQKASWNGIRNVKGRDFPKWSFIPPAPADSGPPANGSKPVAFTGAKILGWRAEKLDRLFVSEDGNSAVVVVSNGEFMPNDKRYYIQCLNLITGTAGKPIKLPVGMKLIDALPTERLLILKHTAFSRDELDEYVQIYQVTDNGVEPNTSWKIDPPRGFNHRYEEAWFLDSNRLMTKGVFSGFVIWDRREAKAIRQIPMDYSKERSRTKFVVDPSRRYLAVGTGAAISLIDLMRGRHVATIAHQIQDLQAIAISSDITRIAVLGETEVSSWSLSTGELLSRVAMPSATSPEESIAWAGELLLVGHQYLIDPKRRVLLWQYELAGTGRKQFMVPRASSLWYAPEEDQSFGLYLASIPAPHAAIRKMQQQLGNDERLVFAQPGDKIHLTVETDLDRTTSRTLADAVTDSLSKAGYQVLETAPSSPTALEAVVSCKKQARQEIKINLSRSLMPDSWDIVSRTIEPYFSFVAIRRGDVELWSRGWKAGPNGMIFVNKDETLDEALKRITTPDIELIENLTFTSHLSKPGEATPAGAYGISKLGKKGIINDYTGE